MQSLADVPNGNDLEGFDESDDELIDTALDMGQSGGETFCEMMRTHIDTIKDFCDGLEYQIQFKDQHFLDTLEGRWMFSETDAELFKLRKTFKLHNIRKNPVC